MSASTSLDKTLSQQQEVDDALACDFKITTGTPLGELKQGTVVALNADPDCADRRPFELHHVEKFIRDKSDDVQIMRTATALDKTMHFLVHNYLRVPYRHELWCNSNVMFEVWSYISDRFRAVRTDWIKQTPTLLDRAGFRRKQWLEFTVAASAVAGAWCSRNVADCHHYIASQNDFYKFTCLEMIQKCFTELLIYFRMERRLRNSEMLSVMMIMNGLNQNLKQESREQFCMLNVDEGTIEPVSHAVSIQVYGELQAFPEMARTRHVRNVVRIIQCVEQRCWLEFFRLCRVLPWTVVQKSVLLNSFSYVRFRAIVDFVAVEPTVSSQFIARCRGFIPIGTLTEWLMFDLEADCIAFLGVMGLEEFIVADPDRPLRDDGSPNLRLQVSKQAENGVLAVTTISAIAATVTKAGQKQKLFFPPHRDFIGFRPVRNDDGEVFGDPDVRSQHCRINVMSMLETYCPPYREEDEQVVLADCPEEDFQGIRAVRTKFLRSSRIVRAGGSLDDEDIENTAADQADASDDDMSLCTEDGDLADDTYRILDDMAGSTWADASTGRQPTQSKPTSERVSSEDDKKEEVMEDAADPSFSAKLLEHREAIAALKTRDVYEAIRARKKQELERELEEESRTNKHQEVEIRTTVAPENTTAMEAKSTAGPPISSTLSSSSLGAQQPAQVPLRTSVDFGIRPSFTNPVVTSPPEHSTGEGATRFPSSTAVLPPRGGPSAVLPPQRQPPLPPIVVEAVNTAKTMSPSLRPTVESPTVVEAAASGPKTRTDFSSALAVVPGATSTTTTTRVRSSGALHPTFVSPPKAVADGGATQHSLTSESMKEADNEDKQQDVQPAPPSAATQRALALSTELLKRHQRASVFGVRNGPAATAAAKLQPIFPLPWSDIFVTYMTNFFRLTYGIKQVDEVLMYLATLGVAPSLGGQNRARSSSRARRSCSVMSATASDAATIRSDVERRLPLGINVVALPEDDSRSGESALSLLTILLLIGPGVNATRAETTHLSTDYVFSEDVPSLTRKFVAMLRGSDVPMAAIGSGSLIRDTSMAQNIRVSSPALSSFLGPRRPGHSKHESTLRRLETSVQCHAVDYAQLEQLHFHAQLDEDGPADGEDLMLPLGVVCTVVIDATTDASLQRGVDSLDSLILKHWSGTLRIGGVVIVLDAVDASHAEDVEADLREVFWSFWTNQSAERQRAVELMRSRSKDAAIAKARRSRASAGPGRPSLAPFDDVRSLESLGAGRPSFSFGQKRERSSVDEIELLQQDEDEESRRRLRLKLLSRPLAWTQPVLNVCPIQTVLAAAALGGQQSSSARIPRALLACFSSLVSEFEAIWMEELPSAMPATAAGHAPRGEESLLFVDDDI